MVALNGAIHIVAQPNAGETPPAPAQLSSAYFNDVLAGRGSYDGALLTDASYLTVVHEFGASDGAAAFAEAVGAAWMKLSNADRFDGPLGNVCDRSKGAPSLVAATPAAAAPTSAIGSLLVAVGVFVAGVTVGASTLAKRWAKQEKNKSVAPMH